jgi:putative nucleotidyltransferase with HDIG domain
MDFATARGLMEEHISEDNLRKHCLASAAVLRGLARRLGKDEEQWAVAGVLHDLDYDQTAQDMVRHGLVTAEILAPLGVEPEVLQAIKAHNAENLGLERSSELDYALTCGETITGLVVATALVYPDKKLASVKPKSIVKRMKEKAFARGVNREQVLLCEKLGLTINEFAALALDSMREISDDLGL